jgi:uncharacterized protein YraI
MKRTSLWLAGGLLMLSAGAAAAAPATVAADVNLRNGPGTGYGVIGVLPAGSTVNVVNCGGGWCRVATGAGTGYASSSYLDISGGAYAYEPPAVVVEPDYGYDYGPAWGPGWGPGFGFGFGFGGGWHHGGHGHWHHH